LTQACLVERAADYWRRAGERALRRSANVEAAKHLSRGIEVAQFLPPTRERARRELALYIALGPAMRAIKGHSAPETLHAFSRARELMIQEESTAAEEMVVLYGLWGVHFVRAELVSAQQWAEQALALAARHGDNAEAQALGHRLVGETLSAMGEFVEARHYLERTLAVAPERSDITDLRFSPDHRITALAFLCWTLWPLGYLEQAARAAAEARARARKLGHAVSMSHVLVATSRLAILRRDAEAAGEYASRLLAYGAEHGIGNFRLWASFHHGWARFRRGEEVAGLEAMRAALAAAEDADVNLYRPTHLGYFAEAYASSGQHEAGLDFLQGAFALAERTGERMFDAELHRLHGELLLGSGHLGKAEHAFQRALVVARRQEARLWELRAATNLARLWRDQGKCVEARDLLGPVYGWFTEGFDTPDLKRAKTLLEKLR
jgi:predicted ATPase